MTTWAQVANESATARVQRARRCYRILGELYPDAHCELTYRHPLELLVATILSAQCTDTRVNQVTPTLFATYQTASDYAQADPVEMQEIIKPTGFFRTKTAAIIGVGQALMTDFDGQVPAKLTDLILLPGVGRKTANVVLGNAFGIPGITVDTHVGRLSRRLGWTIHEDPVAVERDLMALFKRRDWTVLSHRLIFHGRRVCYARRPSCGECALAPYCPSVEIG